MDLGLNYPFPWNAYGRYFGRGAPPGSEPELGRWLEELERNLGVLRGRLGMRVVRLFLLCNGYNYGRLAGGRFEPPDELHPAFVQDLVALLAVFRAEGMQVIPSLFDFKAFGRAWQRNGCGDRYDILRDPWTQRIVLEQTLARFLLASAPYKDVVFAWEVVNEPAWNVRRLVPRSSAGGPTTSKRELSQFLARAVALIDAHGFASTVGHRFASDLDRFPTGSIRQFHFYPTGAIGQAIVDRHLPSFAATRAILGELSVQATGEQGQPWPELRGRDRGDTRARTTARLRHVARKGYELALLWPDGLDGRGARSAPPGADPIQLSLAAQAGVEDFWRRGVLADEGEQEGPEARDEVAER